MSSAEPAIDFTQIEFPTDRLTVRELRKAIPNSFDLPAREGYNRFDRKGWQKRESLEAFLGAVINVEREIAALAYHTALGLPLPAHVGPRWSAVEALSHDYITLGVTRGEHEVEELIRQIEAQAVAQAKRHRDRGPHR